MTIAPGEYRYEIRRGTDLTGVEIAKLHDNHLSANRSTAASASRLEVDATLDQGGFVNTIKLRYSAGPFTRKASYETDGELLRGTVSTLAGTTAVETKLGRFREVDGDLVIFKAILICHIRQRGTRQWTGRVAVIDPTALLARSVKQTYHQDDSAGLSWISEPAIGDRERIEIDSAGRLIRRIDSHGVETALVSTPNG